MARSLSAGNDPRGVYDVGDGAQGPDEGYEAETVAALIHGTRAYP
jgi:hypothetical protein